MTEVLVGYLDPQSGRVEWLARECPDCMKAISVEEWEAHLRWHAEALP